MISMLVSTVSCLKVNAARDGVIDFVAGAIGATVSVYVGQPLDTVKVATNVLIRMFDLIDALSY